MPQFLALCDVGCFEVTLFFCLLCLYFYSTVVYFNDSIMIVISYIFGMKVQMVFGGHSFFMGPWIPLLWTSGSPCLLALSHALNGLSSGVLHLMTSCKSAWKQIHPLIFFRQTWSWILIESLEKMMSQSKPGVQNLAHGLRYPIVPVNSCSHPKTNPPWKLKYRSQSQTFSLNKL